MAKLKLENIKKTYQSGEEVVALNGVSLGFRKSEFVSILGPSGCGKTTLLNIIGGLDQYDSGDLIINGASTKKYKAADWDTYRNKSIGFVFQSYNLISHQTVLQNVEISMTLLGVSAAERKRRAKKALEDVGLADKVKKKPNQLSGGQMQRVAIARALVNNPDIILADEPTGALDSQTSVQIMEILKEISKTRLVIMVTHNQEIAEQYSDRVIQLLDGEVKHDSNPVLPSQVDIALEKKPRQKKTAMSLLTAASLSFRNLMTKKGRTIITAFAGSIGIIGVALVLSLSNGLTQYMGEMQADTLSGFPISISTNESEVDFRENGHLDEEDTQGYKKYPGETSLYTYDADKSMRKHTNVLSKDYLDYVEQIQSKLPGAINSISYQSGIEMNVLAKGTKDIVKYKTADDSAAQAAGMQAIETGGSSSGIYWQELPSSQTFTKSMYDLIGKGSRMPEKKNEVALVVDEYNRVDQDFLDELGITEDADTFKATDFIGKEILKVVPNDDYYTKENGIYTAASPSDHKKLYKNNRGVKLKITAILRVKEDVESSYLSKGIAYTTKLTAYVETSAKNSKVAKAQKGNDKDVTTGMPFVNDDLKTSRQQQLGADTKPIGIDIYPKDYESKDQIKAYLDDYNTDKPKSKQVVYSDLAETVTNMTSTLLDTVTYVLTGFAAISLIVSTIMIGLITYVSVIERTKEIGILRSVGARKKDISRVFNAETLIIGLAAGLLGVGIAYIATFPINVVIEGLVGVSGIATLNPAAGVALVIGSMALTLIAGLIPARMAARKDPVIALRTE